MVSSCQHCGRVTEFSKEQPTFCAYCGKRLSGQSSSESTIGVAPAALPERRYLAHAEETAAYVPAHRTQPGRMPEQVAGYRLIHLLGSGGMGSVYEAEDLSTKRKVALKLILPDYLNSKDAVERFRQEGRLASTIEHPRCVYVLAADEDESGQPYIVMELMPGATLQSLVEQRGALPIEEALLRTNDVIEGLNQAHKLGVVHRDVKPSNCFLDQEGRVKIGDFGLSKSMGSDSSLTRSGSFIGTPLYASPEQIKGDPVDLRSDIYSVCATLYYLLSGAPPFQAKDAAATLAKIVSETPPPLRASRSDLPPRLDDVIRKGMDRDRDRRWATLDELSQALSPFLTRSHSLASVGRRVLAFMVDYLAFMLTVLAALIPLFGLIHRVLMGIDPALCHRFQQAVEAHPELMALFEHLGLLFYFILFEGLLGTTLGKRLCGLRVIWTKGGPCGLPRASVRSLTFLLIVIVPFQVMTRISGRSAEMLLGVDETLAYLLAVGTSSIVALGISVLLLTSTMRAANGYRGPHEWVSHTRVIRRVRRRLRPSFQHQHRVRSLSLAEPRPQGVPEAVGPYQVDASVRWEPDRRVLLGQDAILSRPVWIVLSPTGCEGPSNARQSLSRTSRPRWLTGGELSTDRWDAYSAPVGCSLADLAGRGGLPWQASATLLEDLAEELGLACADGTLPANLEIDQVWIQPGGQVMLVDGLGSTNIDQPSEQENPQARALELLREATRVALEGEASGARSAHTIRAPLPGFAAQFVERLMGSNRQLTTVGQVLAELRSFHDLPTEVTRTRRALHILILSPIALPVIFLMFTWMALQRNLEMLDPPLLPSFEKWVLAALILFPLLNAIWSAFTRGGLVLKLASLKLVRRGNRPATALQCAWRSLVFWAPLVGLLVVAPWYVSPPMRDLCWWLAAAWLPIHLFLAIDRPVQSLEDRLAGTYVVVQ